MRLDLLNVEGAVAFVLVLAPLAAWAIWPLLVEPGDDSGDGARHVRIAKPQSVHPMRTVAFFGVFFGISVIYTGVTFHLVDRLYGQWVARLAGAVAMDPSAIGSITAGSSVGLRFIVVGYVLSLAIVVRAGAWRKLAMAANALGYLIMMSWVDAALIDLDVILGFPIGPFSITGHVIAIALGLVILARITFASFALPTITTTPRRRRPAFDTLALLAALLAMFGAVLAIPYFVALANASAPNIVPNVLVPAGTSYGLYALFSPVLFALLLLLGWTGLSPRPPAGEDHPPIDVIIPAWNEQAVIGRTLGAIDRAARAYAGHVHVILADDGSTDLTVPIARTAINDFVSASGEIVHGEHEGKGAALNLALEHASADIVVRIDADTTIHQQSLANTTRWFRRPEIGQVGAFPFPDSRGGWLNHMRTLECISQFGFNRRGLQAVDGVVCIPGTFTAFRRRPAVAAGGFAEGMNGEDADLTLIFGRLGYRAIIDPKVRIIEDVPTPLAAFREQRQRWNRAGSHVFARHNPLRVGFAGPRTWFTMMRGYSLRVTGGVRLLLLIFAIHLALFRPEYRKTIVALMVLYLVASWTTFVFLALLLAVYRRWRTFLYLPVWYLFIELRRIFALEALLSLPARRVRVAAWGDRRRQEDIQPASVLPSGSLSPPPVA